MNGEQFKPCFVDTNIWLYAFIEGSEPEKSQAARALLQACQPIISVQVINEVCVNLIKKAHFTEEQIRQLIETFYETYPVVILDQAILVDASQLRQQYSLSFWDSMILASALEAQLKIVYTEDIQHGLVIEDRLKVINPFITISP
jgi:predicted nucleic acid-binding protein